MMLWFKKQLDYISAVTEMLNKLPQPEHFYVHVELRDEEGNQVGVWSDEISSSDWYFEETTDK